MRGTGDSQGAQRADLPAVQAETTEDRLLPFGEERPNPAESTGHLECFHLEPWAGPTPATQHAIRHITRHMSMVPHHPSREYLYREILISVADRLDSRWQPRLQPSHSPIASATGMSMPSLT